MRRASAFLLSVLPSDRAQLLLLGGTVCFVIGGRLKWWPPGLRALPERLSDSFGMYVQTLATVFPLLVVLAGMAGYFLFLWPGKRALRRVLLWVFLPAAVGVALMFARLAYLTSPSPSVLESSGRAIAEEVRWVGSVPWRSLSAYHFCFLGLVLVGVFCFWLSFHKTSLPLTLESKGAFQDSLNSHWKRMKILVWILVAPGFFITPLLFVAFGFLPPLSNPLPSFFRNTSSFSPYAMLTMLALIGLSACVFGLKFILKAIRNSIRWPGMKYLLLALAFPILIAAIVSVIHPIADQVQGLPSYGDHLSVQQLRSYLLGTRWPLLLLIVMAFTEELLFRGLLQRAFIDRYGLYRGIFLVGLVWAAFHFPSDFSLTRFGDIAAVQNLAIRIFVCSVLNFVLGWLTIASNSLVPATIAHALYNYSVFSDMASGIALEGFLRAALWGVLAYVLFRYWPLVTDDPQLTVSESAVTGSAG